MGRSAQARIYFAHPYSSWERGLNENTNGLIRQYFPKKSDFSQITNIELERVAELLNNRPRKTLGYRTPNEVFFKQRRVALQVEFAIYQFSIVIVLLEPPSQSRIQGHARLLQMAIETCQMTIGK
jgi:hypothetical protein